MNKIFTAIIALFFISNTQAQQTVVAAGNSVSNANGSVSYSIGQVVYDNYINTNGEVCQGVQYPYDIYKVWGNFITPLKKPVKNVVTNYYGAINQSKLQVNSNYDININNGNYVLKPTKNNDIGKANGVNSVDALLVQRHILNTTKLNNAYKLIAADVDGNKTINSVDVLRIKRLILGTDTTFRNTLTTENRLWTFVDSAYQFPDTTNPFPFKDSISFTNLTSNKTNQTFIGVKLGDVNFDWNSAVAKPSTANCLTAAVNSQPSIENCVELEAATVPLSGGEGLGVRLSTLNSATLTALQTTIHFDNTKFEFVNIGSNKYDIDFNTAQANKKGNISLIWIDKKGEAKTFKAGEELFSLQLRQRLTENRLPFLDLQLNDDITTTAAYNESLNKKGIVLRQQSSVNANQSTADDQLWTIYPNPARNFVNIIAGKKLNGKGSVSITNVLGKPIQQQLLTSEKNTINISSLTKGIYWITIITTESTKTEKLIIE